MDTDEDEEENETTEYYEGSHSRRNPYRSIYKGGEHNNQNVSSSTTGVMTDGSAENYNYYGSVALGSGVALEQVNENNSYYGYAEEEQQTGDLANYESYYEDPGSDAEFALFGESHRLCKWFSCGVGAANAAGCPRLHEFAEAGTIRSGLFRECAAPHRASRSAAVQR